MAAQEADHAAALQRAAARLPPLFTIPAPDAPGLVVLGTRLGPGLDVAGAGPTLPEALAACVGEAVETLSQFATAEFATAAGPVVALAPEQALADARPGLRALWAMLAPSCATPRPDWVRAADLADGRPVWLPADLCLRRPAPARQVAVPWPLSTGCAAAPDRATATLHALLELIERDAAALWWRGGRRGRVLAAEGPAQLAAGALLAGLRGEAGGRRTWLLDITSDLGVPAVAALSCTVDGGGLCCGLAARPTLAAAARRAVVELCQMEAGTHLANAHLAGRTGGMPDHPGRHPLAPPAPPEDLPTISAVAALGAVRSRLEAAGLFPCAVDLTRAEFAIPVVRVVCPGLQPDFPAAPVPRLRAAMAANGVAADAGAWP